MGENVKKNVDGEEVDTGRRAALAKLGIFGLAVYSAPVLANLSDAEAGGWGHGGGRKSSKKSKKSSKKSRKSSKKSRKYSKKSGKKRHKRW